MKAGDKIKCLTDVDNVFGDKLFIKGNIYEIIKCNEYAGPEISSEFGTVYNEAIETADGKLYVGMRDFVNKCFEEIK